MTFPTFRIGGIYRTQGGDFRELRAMPDGTVLTAIAVHIDPATGRRGDEGGTRWLDTGRFPMRADNLGHRAHLLPNEWIWSADRGEMIPLAAATLAETMAAGAMAELIASPAEELAAAKADPEGRELSPAAQALNERDGAANFRRAHPGLSQEPSDADKAMIRRDMVAMEAKVNADLSIPLQDPKPAVKPSPFALSPDLAPTSHQIAPAHGSAVIALGKDRK